MIKKLLLSFLLCLLVVTYPGTCGASEEMIQISRTDLTMLQTNSNRQRIIIDQLQSIVSISNLDSNEAKLQLLQVLNELKTSKEEIQKLQMDLQNSNASIAKANQYLIELKKDTMTEIKTLKTEKNLAYIIAGLLVAKQVI